MASSLLHQRLWRGGTRVVLFTKSKLQKPTFSTQAAPAGGSSSSPSPCIVGIAKNAVVGGSLWGAGEILGQFVTWKLEQEEQPKKGGNDGKTFTPDPQKFAQVAFFGGCLFSPAAATWYSVLKLPIDYSPKFFF